MLFAYFPMIVLDGFARLALASMKMMSAPPRKKSGSPTIIVMG